MHPAAHDLRLSRRALALVVPLLAALAAAAGAQAPFKLQTRPTVAGAEVLVDGRPMGTTAAGGALFVSVVPGDHRVQVVSGGVVIADRQVRFDAELNFVAIPVRPPPAEPAAPSYKVVVDTNVAGAAVSVDGRRVATTQADGRALLELAGQRTYRLVVSKPGYAEVSTRLAVADLDLRLPLRLVPAAGGPPPPPPSAAAPVAPASLLAAGEAFFRGDYAQTLALLEGAIAADPRVQAQVELFRAAAGHALYVLGGERDAALLAAASEAVQRCRRAAPQLAPDRRAFSPRFLEFFARPG